MDWEPPYNPATSPADNTLLYTLKSEIRPSKVADCPVLFPIITFEVPAVGVPEF